MAELQRRLGILPIERRLDGELIRVVFFYHCSQALEDALKSKRHRKGILVPNRVAFKNSKFPPAAFKNTITGNECAGVNAENNHETRKNAKGKMREKSTAQSGLDLKHCHNLFVDVEVRIHVLHIVVLFEGFHQLENLLGIFPFNLDSVLRN